VPESLEISTTIFGDVFWGRRMNTWSQESNLKNAYPFSGLDTFQKNQQDYWIANLECPVTKEIASTFQTEVQLKFSCSPDYLIEAKKYFTGFSLANNHTDNMQEYDGFAQTKDYLSKNQIQYFGHYDGKFDEICNVLSFEASPIFQDPQKSKNYNQIISLNQKPKPKLEELHILYTYNPESLSKYFLPIAFCGYHGVFKLPTTEELEVIETYSQYFPVISMPHQGVEYSTKPNTYQKNIYRRMIDLGATAVIGGHTHSILPTEIYKNKLIAYSTGNFIFDQQSNKQVTTGLGVSLNWKVVLNSKNLELLNTYKNCQAQKCLEIATNNSLSKLDFQPSYNFLVSDSSNKLTKKADSVTTNRIINLITN
jgi:hypothetical protein